MRFVLPRRLAFHRPTPVSFGRVFLLLSMSFVAQFSGAAAAQSAPGAHRGLLVTMLNDFSGASHVLQLGSQNVGTVHSTNPTGAWPLSGNAFGVARDPNNRDLIVPGITSTGRYALVRWSPSVPGVVATLWTSPSIPGPFQNYADFATDSDGEYVTIDNVSSPQGVMFFEPATAAWQRVALPSGFVPVAGTGGFVWDRLQGGFVVSTWGGTVGTTTVPSSLYRLDYRGGNSTVLNADTGTSPLPVYGGDLLQNGDWISSSRLAANGVYLATPGQSGWRNGPAFGAAGWDVTAEHFAKPGIGVWVGSGTVPYGVYHLDLTSATPVVTTVYAGTMATMPTAPCEVAPLYTNDLVTVRTGARTWDVRVNPEQPALANKPYIVGASLSGATRIQLPDGREAFITPDDAFGLSTSGRLAPFITNTIGTLDANGRATCGINLAPLGTGVNGLVIHFAAVIIDPAAPSGIAHVTQPWAFVVENR